MRIKFSTQARVVDITADVPKSSDIFLVDTNVWYWLTYTRASQNPNPPYSYQTIDYPNYINNALSAKALICVSVLSLIELTHLIEKSEREIYERLSKTQISTKQYRHNFPKERSTVISEVGAAWGQVRSLAKSLDDIIDTATADQALIRFQNEKVDGYDLLMLETMKKNKIIQLITDDGDFTTVPGVQVFTANKSAIVSAANQNKLLKR